MRKTENQIKITVMKSGLLLTILSGSFYVAFSQKNLPLVEPAGAIYLQFGAPSMIASASVEKIFGRQGKLNWAANAGIGINNGIEVIYNFYGRTASQESTRVYLNVPLGVALHIPFTLLPNFNILAGINATLGNTSLSKTGYIISGKVGFRYYMQKQLMIQLTYNPAFTETDRYTGDGGWGIPSLRTTRHWEAVSFGIGIYLKNKGRSGR